MPGESGEAVWNTYEEWIARWGVAGRLRFDLERETAGEVGAEAGIRDGLVMMPRDGGWWGSSSWVEVVVCRLSSVSS